MKGDKKMTKQEMKRRETVEKWLDKHIKMMNKRNSSDMDLDNGVRLMTCGQSDYVQLYDCIQKIGEILPYLNISINGDDERKEYSFTYKGVQFIEVQHE